MKDPESPVRDASPLKRFWVSFYTVSTEQPETPWLYWCSGQVMTNPQLFTICALVDAKDEREAKAKVLSVFGDAAELPFGWRFNGNRSGWRFCDEKPLDWTPRDRFPGAS